MSEEMEPTAFVWIRVIEGDEERLAICVPNWAAMLPRDVRIGVWQ